MTEIAITTDGWCLISQITQQMYSILIVTCALVLMAALVIIENVEEEKKKKLDKFLFLTGALIAVGFVIARPTGIVSDDYGYEPKFNALCPVLECGHWIQSSRDFAWYTMIALLKSFFDTPRVMLWVAGFFLMVKFVVIYLLTLRKSLALLIYMAVFYIIQDVIAFRVSAAATIFLLSFYFVSRRRYLSALLAAGLSGLFHIQAILAPLALLGAWAKPKEKWITSMVCVSVLLLVLGLYPSGDWMKQIFEGHLRAAGMTLRLWNLLAYFFEGDPEQVRAMPLVVPPLLLLVLYVYNAGVVIKDRLLEYSYFSIGLACFFLWLLAFNASPQMRIFHFFLSPLPILIGNAKFNRPVLYGAIGVSVIFLMKYNVLHQMLFDYRQVHLPVMSGGYLTGADAGVSCGEGCYKHKFGNALWLKAFPDSGYRFMGWEDGCQKYKKESVCHLVVDHDWTILPIFKKPFTLSIQPSHLGTVLSSDGAINCGSACQVDLDPGSRITLYAQPYSGYYLDGWVGPCSSDSYIDCRIQVSGNTEVSPVYAEIRKHMLLVEKNSGARIVSDPPGIDCGGGSSQCLGEFHEVNLRLELGPGSGFSQWQGCVDNAKITCRVDLDDDRVVSVEVF